jgi:hypothetical protein
MSQNDTGFAEFFRTSWDPCLRAVAASTGDLLAAEEQVAEAFAMNASSYTCTSTPPSLNSSDDNSFGLLYGGPGPS